ncbi:hypothetical protein D3C71_2172760 [compost metagenome]
MSTNPACDSVGMPTAEGAASTKFNVTMAAAYTPLPVWLAVTAQVPAPTMVTVVPATVQMAGVVLV